MTDDLMTLTPDDLAELLRIKRTTIMSTIVRQPGFPASITGTQKPRWLKSEVLKFLKRKSAKTAQPA